MGLAFIPIEHVEVVKDDVSDLVSMVEDPSRGWGVPALLFVRDEQWADEPLYYVFGQRELEELLQQLAADPEPVDKLTREQVFELLNVHEYTRAEVVGTASAKPDRPAAVLDEQGALTGVWAPVIELMAEPPGNGGGETANGGGGGEAPDDRRGDEETVDTFFRRTPHLDVSEDEPLAPGTEFLASVYLDQEAAKPGETVEEVVIDLPPELDRLDVEVMLTVSSHFELDDDATKTLTMHRDDERSPELPFKVKVRHDVADAEDAAMTAYFTYNHRACGRVQRTVAIGAAAPAAEPGVTATETAPAAELAIDARAKPADLTVEIVETPEEDGQHFLVTVRTTLIEGFVPPEPEPWNFGGGTEKYMTDLMNQFTRKGAKASERLYALKGAGADLYDKAPDVFRKLFWQLIDEGKPLRTIFVNSAEPNIPWELMCPRREDGTGKRKPLGVEFAVGRWVQTAHTSPRQYDAIEDSYVVAPVYPVPLKNSKDEADWVCAKFGGLTVTPAVQQQLDAMLAQKPVGLLHFVAHGQSGGAAAQSLQLEDDAVFNAVQVRGMDGLEEACRKKSPLVFLNACEVGRAEPSLVGAGGFAAEFIKAGARGIVAPLWSVKDSLAHGVAVEFYTAALATPDRPFADILKDIRSKAYADDGGEDTYAAYCFYGDPLTALAV
jgi:CHAT domain-containing protein